MNCVFPTFQQLLCTIDLVYTNMHQIDIDEGNLSHTLYVTEYQFLKTEWN